MNRWMKGFALWAMAGALAWAALLPPLLGNEPRPAETYAFKHYGVDQGLSNLAVLTLAVDPAGYLWAGTEDGLFKYDGRRFLRFHLEEGLPSASILRVQAAADGWIWADTEGGLVRGLNGRFESVTLGKDGQETSRQTLAVDRLGGVWIGGSTGLWYGRGAAPLQKVGGLSSGAVDAAWVDPEGKKILVGRKGSISYRGPDGQWLERKLEGEFALDTPQSLLLDRLGRIWVRSAAWLLRYPNLDSPPENLTDHLPAAPSQRPDVLEDSLGRIWAPTSLGLVCFDGGEIWELGRDRGLDPVAVNVVILDREGNLWVGSEGLHRLLGGLAWGSLGRRQGLPIEMTWSLARTRAGALFAGTHQGLAELRGGRWTVIPDTQRRTINALAEDAQGGLWAGGMRPPKAVHNALFYRPQGGTFRSVPLPGVKSTIGVMAAGSEGMLWLGTLAEGLHQGRLGPQGMESTRIALPRQIPEEAIHGILLDNTGRPLVSGTKGLAWWDGAAWQRMGKAEGLLGDHSGPIALAPDGTLWLAYWELHGITRLRRKGKDWEVIEHLSEPRELVADAIYSLGVDARGALWVGTSVGVRRWDGHRLRHFSHHDGLPGDDTSGNAFWADPNGDVWFGLTAGIAHFDSQHAPPDPQPPTGRLDSFHDGADHPLALGGRPELKYRDRTVRFEFSAATFLMEDRLKPQVRLMGFEDEWRDTDGFSVRYTGLPPGHYRFEARVRTIEGLVGPSVSQAFIILPPWWRTWWAIGFGLAALAGGVHLAIRWRTGFMLRRMVELEALVQERTWNLEDANVALSKANGALEEASMVDPLTGLKNRRYLGLSLPEEIARVVRGYHQGGAVSKDHDLAFLLVDLDHFKMVNDTYGHGAGDAVLKQAAAILRKVCRETDTVVRWGGEEFLIVAKAANRNQIEAIGRNLCEGIRSHPFDVGQGVMIHKTCSVGFTAFPVVPADPTVFRWEEAVEVADQCLYAAKNSGRDHYVGVWAAEGVIASQLESRLLSELPRLAAEGLLNLATSLPEGQALFWK